MLYDGRRTRWHLFMCDTCKSLLIADPPNKVLQNFCVGREWQTTSIEAIIERHILNRHPKLAKKFSYWKPWFDGYNTKKVVTKFILHEK